MDTSRTHNSLLIQLNSTFVIVQVQKYLKFWSTWKVSFVYSFAVKFKLFSLHPGCENEPGCRLRWVILVAMLELTAQESTEFFKTRGFPTGIFFGVMLAVCWAYVGPLLAHLGLCWRLSGLRFNFRLPTEAWFRWGLILGRFRAYAGPFGGYVGPLLGHFGIMLGLCWVIWGSVGSRKNPA